MTRISLTTDPLFPIGSCWKHVRLGIVVRILDKTEQGKFLVGFAPEDLGSQPFTADYMTNLILRTPYTAMDLLRDFEALENPPDRWQQILENLDEAD